MQKNQRNSKTIAFTDNGIYAYASGAPWAVGGAERQQWLLARALAANGWSVAVGVTAGMRHGQREVINKVHFSEIGRGPGHVMCAWARFLSAERPQWWYWRTANHLLGPAVAIARAQNVRTIFSAALDPDVIPRRALYHRPRWWPLYAWGLSWADKIFVQHTGQFNALALKWRAKSYIVPSLAGDSVVPKPHSDRDRYVAWVGQLKYPKRPDLLIRIAQQLPELRFVACGGPSEFGSPAGFSGRMIESLRLAPNIDYRGQVAPEEATQLIANAALLLSTSDEEGFPNTFLQAWTHGTPVISLKVDPDQVIDQAKLGEVCSSLEQAGNTIRRLIGSIPEREAIALRSRRYVEERHSEAAVMKAFAHAIVDEGCGSIRGFSFGKNHS